MKADSRNHGYSRKSEGLYVAYWLLRLRGRLLGFAHIRSGPSYGAGGFSVDGSRPTSVPH
jgi:hypothetical protein